LDLQDDFEVTGVDICSDKVHTYYGTNKGNIEHLLKFGKHAPPRTTSSVGPSSAGPSTIDAPSSSQGPSHSKGHLPSSSKKKSILNFLSQGLFACFNVDRHNAQEIRTHRQQVDEKLLRLETHQKSLLAQHNIEHSLVCGPMDFPPPIFNNPCEAYGEASMMYGGPPDDIDDEDFGGGETDEEDSLWLPTPHKMMTIEGPPPFWQLMPKGE
jgi:hypothetical protein